MRVCIYTAICGGYDDLKVQPEQTIPCDFVCFTDEPARLSSPVWRIASLGAPGPRSARLRSKTPKVLPHSAFAALDAATLEHTSAYDVTIWIDASIQILRSTFAETLVDAARQTGFAAVGHPERDCIVDEALASLGVATRHKYAGMPLLEQVEHYRAQGYPDHHGLIAGGVIARDMHSRIIQEVDDAWWAEIQRWSVQDQLSLPYVLWKLGVRCNVIDLHLWRNRLFEVEPHFDAAADDLERRVRPDYAPRAFQARAGGDALGWYQPETGLWRPDAGADAHTPFSFGPARSGCVPLLGDWDGDGIRTPGLYDPATGTFSLRNSLTSGPADVVFSFGPPGALPVTGDWDGDGRDSIGIYLPDDGYWAFANRNAPGNADVELHFGEPGKRFLPIAGDWDGRGTDRIGLYDPTCSGWFLLTALWMGAPVNTFSFGPPRGVPVVGDWNGDAADEVGVFLPEQGQAFLASSNRNASSSWRTLLDPAGALPVTVRVPGPRAQSAEQGTRTGEWLDLRHCSQEGTPERIVPEDLLFASDHLARYAFAAHWAPSRRVLDLCCGVGYGSNLLAAAGARLVVGIDIEVDAIRYAKQRYESNIVEFICHDATRALPVSHFDLVVCFEGVEHVRYPEALVRIIATALAPGGTALVSSPNGAFFAQGFSGNPYHVKEFTGPEFQSLLGAVFEHVELYCQSPDGHPFETRAWDLRPRPASGSSFEEDQRTAPLVWIAICQNPRPSLEIGR